MPDFTAIYNQPARTQLVARNNKFDFHAELRPQSAMTVIFMVMLFLAALAGGAEPARKDATFTEFFRQTSGWAAGDGAISIPLSDGRVLWLFGDSYIDQFDTSAGTLPCLFDARNAVLVQDHKDILRWHLLRRSDGGKTFLRPPGARAGEAWPCLWPGAGIQLGRRIYIYAFEMRQTPAGGNLGFKRVGQFWTKLSWPGLEFIGCDPLHDDNGIGFWCGFITDPSAGFTYAFGNKPNGIGSDVFVARFPTANPEGAWKFWDGQQWNASASNAARVGQGASYSVQVCRVGGKYVLTTTAFSVACDQGKDIYIATSDRPTGPFSSWRKIYTVDDTVEGHHPFFYAAEAHPEFVNPAGEMLITYSINGYEPCVPTCVNGRMNPDYYRPRAIRLPLTFLRGP